MSAQNRNKPDLVVDEPVVVPAIEPEPAKPAASGVKMSKDGKTVTAHKPTTVTRLKSQGWAVEK